MPIAAWDVYKRGQDALRHMQELADVSQFLNGVQKWTDLENKMKDIDGQIKTLEETSRKGAGFSGGMESLADLWQSNR